MLLEIRWHVRAGQGAITGARVPGETALKVLPEIDLAKLYNQIASILIRELMSSDPAVSTWAQEQLLAVPSTLVTPFNKAIIKSGDRQFIGKVATILGKRREKIASEGIIGLYFYDAMRGTQSELYKATSASDGRNRACSRTLCSDTNLGMGCPPEGRPLSTDIQAAIAQAIENIVGNLTP